MRLAIYTDDIYRRDGDAISFGRAHLVFMVALARELEHVVLLGRLDPQPGRASYALPQDVGYVALPHYPSLSEPRGFVRAVSRSLWRFWRVLDGADAVWLFGPHPLALAFAAIALARRRRVLLGVRQDWPRYVANRHPGRRWIRLAALALESAYRLLARRVPTIVVGPDLARHFKSARRLLVIAISLVRERDLTAPGDARRRAYDGELRLLSVGRLETEKNPLLLADILLDLRARDPRWRLVVCGDGPRQGDLAARLEELGVAEHAELRGYVPIDGELPELYRTSHAFLHVSWTEGLPQVLFEAFAAGTPVVASAVGGVATAAQGAALLVPPGNADAAAEALGRVADDTALRVRLVESGLAQARRYTMEAECRRVADFVRGRY